VGEELIGALRRIDLFLLFKHFAGQPCFAYWKTHAEAHGSVAFPDLRH
jgi:hypothetical protein